MEAIQPGSSTAIRSPNTYETVSPFTEDNRYSYYTSHEPQPPESAVIYDEPDITGITESHGALAQVQEPPPAEAEYDEPILMSPTTTNQTCSQPQNAESHKEKSDDDDYKMIYSNIPEELAHELEREDSYVEIVQTNPPAPSRNVTIPKEMDSITEISSENLDNLDPKEVQLWMLLQMQKMVQKMEDVYGTSQPMSPRASKRPTTKPYSKAKAPPPPSSLDPPSEVMKETDHEDTGSEPTRQDLYINLDTISEAITESPPPPIPPRTYQDVDSYRRRTHSDSKTGSQRTESAASRPDHSRPYNAQSKSKTLPPLTTACPEPSPMLAQDIQVNQQQIGKTRAL